YIYIYIYISGYSGHNDWGVIYPRSHICAFKGSTVEIRCSYSYPSRMNDHDTAAEETFWFTRFSDNEPVDLRADSEYSGRVQYHCGENDCTLRITDLRESDSAEYKFRFITNQPGGKYTGEPGVTLSVTDPDVQVQVIWTSTGPTLICSSSCLLSARSSFVWYKREKEIQGETSPSFRGHVDPEDSYSCAYEGYRSPPVCEFTPLRHNDTLKLFHIDFHIRCSCYLQPADQCNSNGSEDKVNIHDSSVNLTCSIDANPAAKYTWYKEKQLLLSGEPQLVFTSVQSSDSGEYYCTAENELGKTTSEYVSLNVFNAAVTDVSSAEHQRATAMRHTPVHLHHPHLHLSRVSRLPVYQHHNLVLVQGLCVLSPGLDVSDPRLIVSFK
uniref:B-cell receptor CD22 n=1 Tax=Seriola dumerili TaxID=41447 RepID=A0A3B4TA26_SERDU